MEKIKRIKDLPAEYTIPNACEWCKSNMGFRTASEMKWASDMTESGTHAFCSAKCRNAFLAEWKHP